MPSHASIFVRGALHTIAAAFLFASASGTHGQTDAESLGWDGVTWQNLNPGGGGAIQSITLDPNVPDRVYLASDMEGAYRSDDGARTWQYIAEDLSDSYVNKIAVEPGNPDRLYAGTLTGLEVSDDAGESWRRIDGVAGPIGLIWIDPDDPARALALPGEMLRWGLRPWHREMLENRAGPLGERNLYISDDRGETWSAVKYAEASGRRDILSIADASEGPKPGLYLGALSGVFHSPDRGETWRMIQPPAQTGDHLGSAVSPDGRVLYASYRMADARGAITTSEVGMPSTRGPSRLFALRLDDASMAWHDLSSEADGYVETDQPGWPTLYWLPVIDPSSDGVKHELMIGAYRPRRGFWQVSVDWSSDAKPRAAWEQVLWYRYEDIGVADGLPWDNGWEMWGVVGKQAHFTPESWGDDFLYAVTGQTAFRVDASRPDFADHWEPIYTRFVREQDGHRFYRTRGFQSMLVYEADALKNYVVQSVADNCMLESFDGGYSWAMRTKPGPRITSRSNAVRIIRELDTPIVLAHAETGWGAGANGGTLWGKRLRAFSPQDEWMALAGGDDAVAGLPDHLLDPIVSDPHDPRRVYVGTGPRGEGLYVIDDIEALFDAAETGSTRPRFQQIAGEEGTPQRPSFYGPGLVVDPRTPDVLWVGELTGRVWRGEKQASGWSWQVVLEGAPSGTFDVWSFGEGVAVVAGRRSAAGDADVVISLDDGASWRPIVSVADAEPLRDPAWYRPGLNLEPAGLVGADDRLFFSFITPAPGARRALGFFEARLTADGTLDEFIDRTADLGWPHAVSTRIIEREPNLREIYMATRGMGLWRRPLPPSESVAGKHGAGD